MALHFLSTAAPQCIAFQGAHSNLLPKFLPLSSTTTELASVKGCSRNWAGHPLHLRNSSRKHNQPRRTYSTISDDKYINKENFLVSKRLYDYILSNVREPEVLQQLREETAALDDRYMQASPETAQLLSMLVQILEAERCIEVGVYTGYSSLAIALVLPESGRLVACDTNAKTLEVARRFYERARVSHKVDVRHGLAADTLKSLLGNGEACSYDFAFVDADKTMQEEYFELLLQLVRVGGLIVIDNVLWFGNVVDPMANDEDTISIRRFNEKIMKDDRISISMVPIGDGVTICRKRR